MLCFFFRDKTDNLFGSSPKSEPPASPIPPEPEPEKTSIPHLIEDNSSNASKVSSREPSPIAEPPVSPRVSKNTIFFVLNNLN